MSTQFSLKEIERRAYLSYHQDGLVDIVLGLGIAFFGTAITFDLAAFLGVMAGVLFLAWMLGKRWVTLPRIGYVDFGDAPRKKLQQSVLLGVVLLGMILIMLGSSGLAPGIIEFLRNNDMIVIGFIWVVLLLIIGSLIRSNRMLVYAGLVLLIFSVGSLLSVFPGYFIIPTGLIISIAGLALLINFIRTKPAQSEEALYDEE